MNDLITTKGHTVFDTLLFRDLSPAIIFIPIAAKWLTSETDDIYLLDLSDPNSGHLSKYPNIGYFDTNYYRNCRG